MTLKHSALVALAAAIGAQAQVFTVNCAPLTQFRGDPIVSPGVISSHVHAVVGGTAFSISTTPEQARAAQATTCDKILDNSNYWQPQMYHQRHDGQFELVTFQGSATYYIARACDYAPGRQNCNGAPLPIAPPAGLKMLVGDLNRRTFNASSFEDRAISHVCLDTEPVPDTNGFPTRQCQRIRSETFFPSCWDGVNLDSSTHKDHVAFPAIGDYNTGVCPESHPKAILSVFYEFFYDTGSVQNFNRFVYADGDATGYSLHADYFQGWKNQTALELAISTCTGPNGVNDSGCSLNVGPNGPGVSGPQKLQTPAPTENIGLNGPIAALPGNNPIH
ncbi:hypothetical protein BBK36DRAFT_1163344 [Trichoderma citrinoviride]|uniref:DUF1996 domain-containing protein n=1 Tax=Trichoderma citrinoviride TaxID=58853 RepID=A0A2T4AY73_9HYPO|nr:hypothetical protein BBK36DRAFT_1163344 [Trichoderma citrinoviride]PTB62010.1 hypothetical protein BBK36DRAFT_1163344 [Trichoderma citrinoviride]